MKKIFGITLAAVCALSVAAFGFTGCKEKSDEVTAEEWAAAMTSEKALNVTMNVTYSTEIVNSENGVKETQKASGSQEIKTAFEWYNGITTSSLYIKGNSYMYGTETETYTDADGSETATAAETQYAVFEEGAYSYVSKTTETGLEDKWAGKTYSLAGTVLASDAYYECKQYITAVANDYDKFVYTDGVYKYEDAAAGSVMYIRINDGYLTYMKIEEKATLAYNSYSYSNTAKYEIKFSNYGTTTVEVPEEYTYASYLANHSA